MFPASFQLPVLTPTTPLEAMSGTSVFATVPGMSVYQPDWRARGSRYQTHRSYYDGSVYNRYLALARVDPLINAKKLYEGTRLLFSPLRRVVNVDVAKVPAQWALSEQDASRATRQAVADLRKRINAKRVYSQALLYGAVAGELGLLVTGTRDAPSVTAVRPDACVVGTLHGNPFGAVVQPTLDGTGRYEYALIVTPDSVTTYRNGQPYSYDGQPEAQRNPFGVVTLFFGPYRLGEQNSGEPAFGGVVEILDRVNELSSLTLDVIERNAEPIMVGTGVDDIQRDATNDTILTTNENAKFYTVSPQLAIADTLKFIQDIRGEYKNLLPQLALDDLKGAHDVAYDTVVTLLQELGDHVLAVRTNVDPLIESVERLLLGDATPPDYALNRERRWLALTEMQQLMLDAQRLTVEEQQLALNAARSGVPSPLQETVNWRIQEK